MLVLVLRSTTGYASRIVASNSRRPARQLRIIGGEWRGRRWQFPAGSDIRPTPDRVRETLFNWLAGRVAGARVLDLFAGSGALGLEAHSRGAAHVTFVERDAEAARSIGQVLRSFGSPRAEVRHDDALGFLAREASPYDIVFLDPPFDSDLLARAAAALEAGGWLAEAALVYLELPARTALPALPPAWQAAKSGRAGDVGYYLVTRAAGGRTARGAAEV
ncbi:MAG: Ribosomal RNA small subunit methyltransferase D [Steroidobacteraceae bacterium]|nr:Ribosomal RNA small subunit methyltransferase D [Steroidobacteraceae bacterium]